MYKAKLEFPEGWGGGGSKPFCGWRGRGGGMDIFWNHTLPEVKTLCGIVSLEWMVDVAFYDSFLRSLMSLLVFQ